MTWNKHQVPTPCYIIDKGLLKKNMAVLDSVRRRTGCEILVALKGFSCWSVFDILRPVLTGTAASSLFEAKLGREEFDKEVHLCAPAFREDEFPQCLEMVDHIVFNSFNQWEKFKSEVENFPRKIEAGLRINPEHSEVKTELYDPCASSSRMGIKRKYFEGRDLAGISGLHFHTLCELNADSLERTLKAFEEKFGEIIKQMQWVNFGGGHHITRDDYDIDLLCQLINDFKDRYDVKIYLEPGEAVALNTGFLVTTVLDIVKNGMDIAILDTSACAHMPDILEMPYRPHISDSDLPGKKKYTYRLAGPTCLSGDIMGDYSFDEPLKEGDRLVFHDMAHYTMVKNNMFNGINLPDIVIYDDLEDAIKIQRHFEYLDFRNRLS